MIYDYEAYLIKCACLLLIVLDAYLIKCVLHCFMCDWNINKCFCLFELCPLQLVPMDLEKQTFFMVST